MFCQGGSRLINSSVRGTRSEVVRVAGAQFRGLGVGGYVVVEQEGGEDGSLGDPLMEDHPRGVHPVETAGRCAAPQVGE